MFKSQLLSTGRWLLAGGTRLPPPVTSTSVRDPIGSRSSFKLPCYHHRDISIIGTSSSLPGLPLSSKWKMREATLDDRDDVISIIPKGSYEGDYLPDKYTFLMNDPNYYGYVCVYDGKIVGFSGVSVINGGQTGVMRSGRIQNDLQGMGMLSFIGSYIMMKHPYLKNVAYFTASNMERMLSNQLHTLITKVKYAFYQGSRTVARNARMKGTSNSPVSAVSEGVLQDLFSNSTRYPKVFKCNHLIVDTIPYMSINSNIQPILRTGKGFISFQNDPMKTLVTFGSHFRLPSGEIFCNLMLHGTVNECLSEHIAAHIQVFCEEVHELFTTALMSIPEEDNDGLIREAVVSLGLRQACSKQYNRKEAMIAQVKAEQYPSNKLQYQYFSSILFKH